MHVRGWGQRERETDIVTDKLLLAQQRFLLPYTRRHTLMCMLASEILNAQTEVP